MKNIISVVQFLLVFGGPPAALWYLVAPETFWQRAFIVVLAWFWMLLILVGCAWEKEERRKKKKRLERDMRDEWVSKK